MATTAVTVAPASKFGIQSIEHFFARAAKTAVAVGKAIIGIANNPTVQKDVQAVEQITALIPGGQAISAIEDAAFSVFGLVAKAISEAEQAKNPDGSLSVTIGAQVVADIKDLIGHVENFGALVGMAKPAATKS